MATSIASLTANYPDNPSSLPVSTATQTALDAKVDATLTVTGGAGGVLANRVVYSSAATALHARANAAATARNVLGVTTAAITEAATGVAYRGGIVRIKADSVCVPYASAKAYLSAEAGGLVASSIDGTTYPVLLGQFTESAVGGDGCVAVWLSLDEVRDDSCLWLLDDWEPPLDAQLYDSPVVGALWDAFEMYLLDLYRDPATGDQVALRVDGAMPTIQGWHQRYNATTVNDAVGVPWLIFSMGDQYPCRVRFDRLNATKWVVDSANQAYAEITHFNISNPTTSIGAFSGNGKNIFKAGQSRFKLFARRAVL